jgi:hypothetical protein
MFAFTDQSAMQVANLGRTYVWRKKGEQFSSACLTPKFQKLSKCMVFGMISGRGKKILIK